MIALNFFQRLPSFSLTSAVGSAITPWVNEHRLPRPYLMTFVVTRRCNSRCRMCNIWRQKDLPELSLDQIRTIFAPGFPFVRGLTLTGGEPTLRADLPEIFALADTACPQLEHVTLATSGLNPTRVLKHVSAILERAAQRSRPLKGFVAQVSLDGIGHEHDQVRGIEGFFDRVQETLHGLRQLQRRHPLLQTRLSSVTLPQNLPDVPHLRSFAEERGLPIHFSPVVISGAYYENVGDDDALSLRHDQRRSAKRLYESLSAEESSALRFYYRDMANMLSGRPRSRTCMMGFYGFVLEHDGSVYPCVNCETRSFGNLPRQSFDEVWFGDQATEARRRLRTNCCPGCTSMCYPAPVNILELAKATWRTRLTRRQKRRAAHGEG